MHSGGAATVPEVEKTIVGPSRVLSVDMLRGLTIAFMIMVNDPGDWDHVFKPLDHAPWNGWTITDLVFPAFLFLMGASLVFSMASRAAKGNCRGTMAEHLFSRGGRVFLLGLVLAYFPRMHWTTMRYFGILPRIAVCYVLAGLVLLMTRRLRWLALVVAVILVAYAVMLRWIPVPGFGMPVRDVPLLDMDGNLVAFIDRTVVAWTQKWLHTGALFEKTRDPEGLLSSLPAVASTLLGAMAGVWMRRVGHGRISVARMRGGLLVAGAAMVGVGELWSVWLPINKNLWTSSFVLLMAGATAIILSVCSWLVDARAERWPRFLRAATWPWFVFGANAIAAYTFSEAFVKACLLLRWVDEDGDTHTYWATLYDTFFARHGSTEVTSMLFAIAFVALCFLPNWWLWHKRVFLKI